MLSIYARTSRLADNKLVMLDEVKLSEIVYIAFSKTIKEATLIKAKLYREVLM